MQIGASSMNTLDVKRYCGEGVRHRASDFCKGRVGMTWLDMSYARFMQIVCIMHACACKKLYIRLCDFTVYSRVPACTIRRYMRDITRMYVKMNRCHVSCRRHLQKCHMAICPPRTYFMYHGYICICERYTDTWLTCRFTAIDDQWIMDWGGNYFHYLLHGLDVFVVFVV